MKHTVPAHHATLRARDTRKSCPQVTAGGPAGRTPSTAPPASPRHGRQLLRGGGARPSKTGAGPRVKLPPPRFAKAAASAGTSEHAVRAALWATGSTAPETGLPSRADQASQLNQGPLSFRNGAPEAPFGLCSFFSPLLPMLPSYANKGIFGGRMVLMFNNPQIWLHMWLLLGRFKQQLQRYLLPPQQQSRPLIQLRPREFRVELTEMKVPAEAGPAPGWGRGGWNMDNGAPQIHSFVPAKIKGGGA